MQDGERVRGRSHVRTVRYKAQDTAARYISGTGWREKEGLTAPRYAKEEEGEGGGGGGGGVAFRKSRDRYTRGRTEDIVFIARMRLCSRENHTTAR